jgi:hypothetical protein
MRHAVSGNGEYYITKNYVFYNIVTIVKRKVWRSSLNWRKKETLTQKSKEMGGFKSHLLGCGAGTLPHYDMASQPRIRRFESSLP